uniref:Uncharacterized protein n=1 Tax=Timema bartmani TaxID=61472 RepID=A0A7R9ESU1_9NEOP|nr:unnamed protein product [Timema bartmani]
MLTETGVTTEALLEAVSSVRSLERRLRQSSLSAFVANRVQRADEVVRRDLDNATTVHCELYIRSFGSISPVTMVFNVEFLNRLFISADEL